MELSKIQKDVHDWISQNGGYWPPLSMFARLVEETGELGRELNHVYGMKKRKEEEKIKEIKDMTSVTALHIAEKNINIAPLGGLYEK